VFIMADDIGYGDLSCDAVKGVRLRLFEHMP
jgi:hypothetical protein